MQAVKIVLPVYFLRLTPVNLPRGSVNGSLDIQYLRNRGSYVIERRLGSFVYRIKPSRHVENVLMMKENTSFTVDMRVIFHINDK